VGQKDGLPNAFMCYVFIMLHLLAYPIVSLANMLMPNSVGINACEKTFEMFKKNLFVWWLHLSIQT